MCCQVASPVLHEETFRRIAELKERTTFQVFPSAPKQGTLTTYCEIVNYLLKAYTTTYEISETDVEMMKFTQPEHKTLRQ